MWNLAQGLAERRAAGLERHLRALQPVDGVRARHGRQELLLFCSNDYLGLAGDDRLRQAFTAEAARSGVGSGASHFVTGHRPVHEALEDRLAEWLQRDRVLLFSSGYLANLGVIDALVGRGDHVYQDRLNHASLLDGGRLSGARLVRYAHADMRQLEERLRREVAGRRLIVSDGVFSMDGDIAPLPELAALAARHDAALLVDDAHGFGVLGDTGCGSLQQAGLNQDQVPLLIGTLGKAAGTFGAFVAGPHAWIAHLRQQARTQIYTTAPPPALAAATLTAIEILGREHWRRQQLQSLIAQFRTRATQLGLRLLPSETPIQPVVVGDAAAAVDASRALEQRGILVSAIRPPTVPEGSARLRVTFSALHTAADVELLLDAMAGVPALRREVSG
ncbi:8-amino-7-oxononanoate synthase [Methylonatrum kenyense]|uniref:8-amino-7-oxononanoate synthase n=1 Tax=Methylonatrum kenyense TaxID=455253 RepID=UPI0020BF5E11|nr:8-amino-7-oxononanoate synthase [Methylonatrum kenyense]MCK8516910.1 8-amino-7-oxononanoate synthase [Methylonatrum kenyense]